MWPDIAKRADERVAIEQVGLDDTHMGPHAREGRVVVDRPANHADDLVATLEQELREVRAVLAADAGDESTPHGHPSMIRPAPACGTLAIRCSR